MSQTIKVFFLAAEADPFVKVGELGDVAGSLTRALRALSTEDIKLDVRLILPYHPVVRADGLKPLGMFSLLRGDSEVQVEAFETSLDGMPVYFITGDPIRANGSVYSLDPKLDAEKYAFFSLAVLELPHQINWFPDIIHANDWHTALSLYGLLTRRWEEGAQHVASVITLHNLSFLGPDSSVILDSYGVKLAQTDLPEWARVMPLPLGLWASDSIVAVSPTYSKEILTAEAGCGLNDFLNIRRETLRGILNGIDVSSFDPATDPAIGVNYDARTLEKRSANKALLQERLDLQVDPEVPLLAMISSLNIQKGVDLAFSAFKNLRRLEYQGVILGIGDPKLEAAATKLQELYPDRIRVVTRYDDGLARQIYAGSDMLLMPSRHEPCGQSQMIAMRYGCIPVVRSTGGLKDTVKQEETGFVFKDADVKSLGAAIRTAIRAFVNKEEWRKIQLAGMMEDFSWERSARQYSELYQALVKS